MPTDARSKVRLNLSAARAQLESRGSLPRDVEATLRSDTRPSARALVEALDERRRANRAEGQRLRHMLRFERELWQRRLT